jgi:hypothetical protein
VTVVAADCHYHIFRYERKREPGVKRARQMRDFVMTTLNTLRVVTDALFRETDAPLKFREPRSSEKQIFSVWS